MCSILIAPGDLWWSRVVKIWPRFRGQNLTTKACAQAAAQNRGHVPPGPTRQSAAQNRDHDFGASARPQVAKDLRAQRVPAPSRNLRSKNDPRFLMVFQDHLIPGFRGPCLPGALSPDHLVDELSVAICVATSPHDAQRWQRPQARWWNIPSPLRPAGA